MFTWMDDLQVELDTLERILCGQKEPDSLDFRLLRRLTGNFSDDRRIGEGGCGEVYKGVLPNGNVIAVKKLKKDYQNIIDEKMFLREVELIKVRHQNIVRFLGYCSEIKEKAFRMPDGTLVLVEEREKLLCFPYISNGSLDKHLTDELRGFEWHTRYQIIKGICDGLLHLHKEKGIMHMDLKPANILLGDQMLPKITDFGVSRIGGRTQITSAERLFSRGYTAPEYIDTGVRSWKSDIYSLGVIMIELVTGSRKIPNTTKVLRRWRHRWSKSSKHTPLLYLQVKKCLELAVSCQEINPVNRPFIMDIVRELNNIDSWDGQIRESSLEKIISSSDDMLGIEPLELHFTLSHNKKQISCSIELTNDTDYYMAFRVATTSLLPFSILPDKGIAAPRSKRTTIIILSAQEMTPLLHNLCEEEFIVQSTKIDGSLTAVDITDDTFNDEGANSQEKIGDGDKVVDEVNLTVLFDEMLHEEHQMDVTNLSAEMGSLVTSFQDYNFLDYHEKVIDGFYDIFGSSMGSSRQGKMPSLADLQTGIGDLGFEVIVVNRAIDSTLQEMEQVAQCFLLDFPFANTAILVQRIAELVTDNMGGPVKDANDMLTRWLEKSTELRTSLQTSLLPIGCIKIGLSRHRALLFKILADSVGIPCKLVKGSNYTGGDDDDAVNIIKMDNEREFLVDLMAAPGALIPADILSWKGNSLNSNRKLALNQKAGSSSTVDANMDPTVLPLEPKGGQLPLLSGDWISDSGSGYEAAETAASTQTSSGVTSSVPAESVFDSSWMLVNHDQPDGPSTSAGTSSQQKAVPQSEHQRNLNRLPDLQEILESNNFFADLIPFGDMKSKKTSVPLKGPDHRNNELQKRRENIVPNAGSGRPHQRLVMKNWSPYNDVSNNKQYNYVEDSFARRNVGNNAASSSSQMPRPDPKNLPLTDSKKSPLDRFMDTSLPSRNMRLDFDDVSEYEIPWEDLAIGERIGLGLYGEVYRADWNGTEVAVKKFLDQDFYGDALDEFRSEVRIMRRLRHPNIVLFMGAVTHPPNLSIVCEYLPRGSLYKILHRPNCLIDEKQRIKMALDVAKGMKYLHTSNPTIVHRDLKSPNLLVDNNWTVKVCNFGLSRLKHSTFLSSESTAGTPEWMAPEVLRNEQSNEKCDVYSFGVILWELATLRMPWSGMNRMQIVRAVGFQDRRLDIPKEVDPLVARIIFECWQKDPNLRPSFAQLTSTLKTVQRLVTPSHQEIQSPHVHQEISANLTP